MSVLIRFNGCLSSPPPLLSSLPFSFSLPSLPLSSFPFLCRCSSPSGVRGGANACWMNLEPKKRVLWHVITIIFC